LEFNVPFQHKYGYIRDECWSGRVVSAGELLALGLVYMTVSLIFVSYLFRFLNLAHITRHVLANILRSPYVTRTPPLEARSPGRRSKCWERPPSPAGHRSAARTHPAER